MNIKQTWYLLFILSICCFSCRNEKPQIQPVLAHAKAADFEEAKQVSAQLAEGIELELWAPGPLLSNAVALSFDNQGVAYVAETSRRKSSDIDIRQHWDWMAEDLSLQSIEDTKAFHLKKLATELSDQNTWQEDLNKDGIHDYRDLEVQSEYIRRVWDSDGDGRADVSHLFAADFNSMLTGVAAGVLYYDDNVFVTAAPDVWRLKDIDKDGVADERTKISYGYGIHIAFAGHDMSGLTMGMDGKVYWSIGDMGVNAVGPDGKRWAYPNEGAVMRANPDGSEFEVFAHGVRNPQELDFDAYGNLISVDNDGDHPGEHERYIHILEGSDTGWRINWQYGKYNLPNESYKIWMDEKLYIPHFPGQAAYLLPPLALAYNGPAGLAYNPGTALSKEWNDYFFVSFFTGSSAKSKIQAFKIKPKGASFEITDIKDVAGGIVPTGINFAPDGALYINDWKDSYDKKPTGRIWKLDVIPSTKNPIRTATQHLLKEGASNKSVPELQSLIAHEDRRVRMMAQFELVKKEATAALLEVATKHPNLFARLHALWGIGQLARKKPDAAAPLLPLLNDPNEFVRAQTAKVIGDAKYEAAFDLLIPQLKDASATAQFFAAEALGKLGNAKAFQPLVDLLEKTEETDPHLRHGLVYALSKLDQAQALAALANHPSKYVRIGAVVALRTMHNPSVADFLLDKEPLVVTEAARAINDDSSIPAALPALAKALERTELGDEAFIRRAINANLRLGDKASAERLAHYAQSTGTPDSMRADALWALGYWAAPPVLDRVDGSYRELKGHQIADAQKVIADIFAPMMAKKRSSLQADLITAAGRLNYQEAAPKIFSLFKDPAQKLELRKAALGAIANLKSPDLATTIDLALTDKAISLRQDAQELLSTVGLPEETLVAMFSKILDNNTVAEKQQALASLAKINSPAVSNLLSTWLTKLASKNIAPELQLDVLTAIDNSTFEDLKKQKSNYENAIDSTNLLARYEPSLYGGNEDKGRQIFSRNTTAQCLRCHIIQGYGGDVGPDLSNIAATLDRKNLLLSLVDPNARIAPGYGTVILTLKDGKEIAGVLQEETQEAITLKIGKETIQTVAKSNIQEQEMLPSGMFNMGEILTKEQIRDLMAFLVTLKEG